MRFSIDFFNVSFFYFVFLDLEEHNCFNLESIRLVLYFLEILGFLVILEFSWNLEPFMIMLLCFPRVTNGF